MVGQQRRDTARLESCWNGNCGRASRKRGAATKGERGFVMKASVSARRCRSTQSFLKANATFQTDVGESVKQSPTKTRCVPEQASAARGFLWIASLSDAHCQRAAPTSRRPHVHRDTRASRGAL